MGRFDGKEERFFEEKGFYIVRSDDRKRLSQLLSDSFENYPPMRYFFTNKAKRNLFFDIETQAMQGVCITVADSKEMNSILSFTMPASGGIRLMKYIKSGVVRLFFKLGLKKSFGMIADLSAIDKLMKRYKTSEDYYIHYLATAPDIQKNGLASNLMKTFQKYADENGHGMYLETYSATNVEIYRKMGFELKEATDIKDGSTMKLYALYYGKKSV